MVLGDEGRSVRLEVLQEQVEHESGFNDQKQVELQDSAAQFEELRTGLQQMITQLDINFSIDTNGDLMPSLGEIEERLNELIAAKVPLYIPYPCSIACLGYDDGRA